MEFKLVSPFEPMGDQPQAIKELTAGVENDTQHQTLLGVTGNIKTYTEANLNKNGIQPPLVLSTTKPWLRNSTMNSNSFSLKIRWNISCLITIIINQKLIYP